MRLNRYLASSGICSRRHADEFIFAGRVKVNGKRVDSPGIRVGEEDQVTLNGKVIISLSDYSYWVMNKPRGVVTTMSDPQGRLTVRDLVGSQLKNLNISDRLKPVGRLDLDTSGILLFTDDGNLHHALTHPSKIIDKEYEVELTKPLSLSVLKKLRKGILLSDGILRSDFVDYLNPKIRTVIVMRLHSGKNRIIRRLMEAVGSEIKELRRTSFAGITERVGRKYLAEGKLRELSSTEVEGLRALLK